MIFDPDTLLALLASPLWFIALWAFWKLKQRREGPAHRHAKGHLKDRPGMQVRTLTAINQIGREDHPPAVLFFAFAIFIMIFDPDTLLALLASPLWFIALWAFSPRQRAS
jgi:L-asparagine transporter-like permease